MLGGKGTLCISCGAQLKASDADRWLAKSDYVSSLRREDPPQINLGRKG
jgi:hypothetical protein